MSLLQLPSPSTSLSSVAASASAATVRLIPLASATPPRQRTSSPKSTISISPPPPPPDAIPRKKVLVPIGFGTEEMEAVILTNVLRRAGAHVTVASVEPHLQVEAAGGTKLVADASICDCSDEIFDLVALPGGMPGSARLRDCDVLRQITCKQAEQKRLYGAICAAPAITLLPWGLLKKKKLMRTDDNDQLKKEFNEVEWSVGHYPPSVLIPIAHGSEEIDVVTMIDILRRAKVNVIVTSVEKTLEISASQGTKIVADMLISDAQESIHDLIILPGGTAGVQKLSKSRILKKLLKEQSSAGRICGAVCSSLAILHKQGLLKDKRATAHPSVVDKLKNDAINGAKVVIDGKLITSEGLASVTDFALAIVSKLFGNGRARSVAEGLVFVYPRK